ncbi:MAG: hypothetical protein Q9217_004776 [Psora testacea]
MSVYTDRELGLAVAMLKHAGPDIMSEINFDKVAVDTGYKDAVNARVCCGRFVKKLMGSADGPATPVVHKSNKRKATDDTSAKASGNGAGETPVKKRGRPAAKNKKGQANKDVKLEDQERSEEQARLEEALEVKADAEAEVDMEAEVEGQGGQDVTVDA